MSKLLNNKYGVIFDFLLQKKSKTDIIIKDSIFNLSNMCIMHYKKTIVHRLNNYVHSNGVAYYNRNIIAYMEDDFQKQMQTLLNDMCFITVTFMVLLTICSPLSIMSSNYIDCLEFNQTPPEGSQYLVAPFVSTFFKKNLDILDKGCINYLHEKTLMIFE